MRWLSRSLVAVLVAASTFALVPRRASAQEPPAPPTPPPTDAPLVPPPATSLRVGPLATDVARLDRELALVAARARMSRYALLAIGLGSGAVLIPTGAVLSQRSDDIAQAVGTGMLIGGSVGAAFSLFALRSSPMERVHEAFLARRAAGDDAELVRLTESDWAEAARAAAQRRKLTGGVNIGLGAAATVLGVVFLAAPAGIAGLSRSSQDIVGGALVGPGVPVLSTGVRALLVESDEEASWAMHEAGRAPSGAAAFVPSLAVAPSRGGARATVGFRF